jgi:Na+-transporting NADH:ubiquinone oxidoreductase subunit C
MSAPESVPRTLAVAAIVALVCSLLVSTAVYWLRPIQLAYSSVERNRAVLVAAGLIERGTELPERELGDRYRSLEPRLVDLDAGRFVNADASVVAAYDYREAMEDPARRVGIPAEADIGSLGERPALMPVYLLEEGGELERIVLPVYGQGMWSTIHGHVALEGDLATVAEVWFYEHGETPGIGDRIQNPEWLGQWRGKTVFAADGEVALGIGGEGTPAASRIDAITGATITATAVGRLVRYWLGPDAYGPFLANLRAGEA